MIVAKFVIKVTEYDWFTGRKHTYETIAYQDKHDKDVLWFDNSYGLEQLTCLSEHPEAVLAD